MFQVLVLCLLSVRRLRESRLVFMTNRGPDKDLQSIANKRRDDSNQGRTPCAIRVAKFHANSTADHASRSHDATINIASESHSAHDNLHLSKKTTGCRSHLFANMRALAPSCGWWIDMTAPSSLVHNKEPGPTVQI